MPPPRPPTQPPQPPPANNHYAPPGNYHNYRPAISQRTKTRRWMHLAIFALSLVFALSLSFVVSVVINKGFRDNPINSYYSAKTNDIEINDKNYPLIPSDIKDIANRIQLTDRAKQIFYSHEPKIFNSINDRDFVCANDLEIPEQKIIYGCWTDKPARIYLLKQKKESDLDATAAHEILHAIYYDIFRNDPQRLEDLNNLLHEVYDANQSELHELIVFYEELHASTHEADDLFSTFSLDSELHSFIPAIIEELPEELEEHYAFYFKDRQFILDI